MDAQESFRKMLDGLIAENKPIKHQGEREDFFNLLSHSTLGLGFKNSFFLDLFLPDGTGENYEVANVESVARWLSYQGSKPVGLRTLSGERVPQADIGIYWECLRNSLFSVFPESLERAIRMSKEQDASGKMQGFIIDD